MPIPDSDAVVRAVHRLEFCEDGVTVMLPVRRCELIDGKMIAFLDAGDLEAYLLGYGEGTPLAAPPLPPAKGEEKCADCGCVLDSGTAAVFTVCDACWDKAYPRPTTEPSEAMVEAGESANDRFERLADEFYADTGLVAPGKDDAPECALSTTYEERVKVWKAWNAGRRRAALAAQEGGGRNG